MRRSWIRAADCSGGLWLHVHLQHGKAGPDQPFGGLAVESDLGVAAVRRELEAVMRAALMQAPGDDLGVGFEDHGQVGPVGPALSCQRNARSMPSKRCMTRPDGT